MEIQDLKEHLSKNQYTFLIGNGINRANGGQSWEDFLKSIINDVLGNDSYLQTVIGESGITNTEIQNIIPLEYNRKTGEKILNDELMRIVSKTVESIKFNSVPMLNWILDRKIDILTTNYDFNIENYLFKSIPMRMGIVNSNYKTSNYYPWDKYYSTKSDENSCRVWHIHGDIKHQQSIILSLDRYLGAINKTMKVLQSGNPVKEQLWDGLNTWLHIFFNKPLVVVGLSLEPQELFLRWLLIKRLSILRNQKVNMPTSFYLTRSDSQVDYGKIKFLEFTGFEIIKFPEKNLYDHPIWSYPR